MKRAKMIAVMTALVMILTCLPMVASAASAPNQVKNVKAVCYDGDSFDEDKGIYVTWDKVKNANGYMIYMKKAGGKYKLMKTIKSGKKTYYGSTKVQLGSKYTVKVKAYKNVKGKKVYGKFGFSKAVKIYNSRIKLAYKSLDLKDDGKNARAVIKFVFDQYNRPDVKLIKDNCMLTLYSNSIDEGLDQYYAPETTDEYSAADMARVLAGQSIEMVMVTPEKVRVGTSADSLSVPDKSFRFKPGKTYYVEFQAAKDGYSDTWVNNYWYINDKGKPVTGMKSGFVKGKVGEFVPEILSDSDNLEAYIQMEMLMRYPGGEYSAWARNLSDEWLSMWIQYNGTMNYGFFW